MPNVRSVASASPRSVQPLTSDVCGSPPSDRLTWVPPSTLEAPAEIDPHLNTITQAINDHSGSFAALLLKSTDKCAHPVLKRLVANTSTRPVYACKLNANAPEDVKAHELQAIAEELKDLPADIDITLYLFWKHSPSLLNASEESELQDMLRTLNAARPNTKLVISTPATRLFKNTDLGNVEVLDITPTNWDLEKAGFEYRTKKLMNRFHVDAPMDGVIKALEITPYSSLKAVFRYANILHKRSQTEQDAPPTISLEDIQTAALCLEARTLSSPSNLYAEDDEEAKTNTSFAEQFLIPVSDFSLEGNVVGVPDDVRRFLTLIKNYESLKSVVPGANKTLLMEGPPGTGKTTIAKALASEAGYPLFAPKSSALINKYIGESTKNTYKLFDQIRAYAKERNTTAILFLDEIDAILSRREDSNSGGSREYGRVVNAFLETLQGINSEKGTGNLVIVAATNRADQLDRALLDRFSLKVEVGLPDRDQLKQIFKLHLQGRAHNISDSALDAIVSKAQGFSGRNVVNVLDRAGYIAFEKVKDGEALKISEENLMDAVLAENSGNIDPDEPPYGMYS